MSKAKTRTTKVVADVPPSIRIPDDLAWPAGFASGAGAAGLKAQGRLDVAVLAADEAVPAAAMFTTNLVQAAPVLVCKEHLRKSRGMVRAVVANAGNANACTGAGPSRCEGDVPAGRSVSAVSRGAGPGGQHGGDRPEDGYAQGPPRDRRCA